MRLGLPCSSTPPVAILRPLIVTQLCSALETVLNSKTEISELTAMAVCPYSNPRPVRLAHIETAHHRTLFRLLGARIRRICGTSSPTEF